MPAEKSKFRVRNLRVIPQREKLKKAGWPKTAKKERSLQSADRYFCITCGGMKIRRALHEQWIRG